MVFQKKYSMVDPLLLGLVLCSYSDSDRYGVATLLFWNFRLSFQMDDVFIWYRARNELVSSCSVFRVVSDTVFIYV